MATNVFEELRWRGLVYDHTEGVPQALTEQKMVIYNGFDPTSDSLHIGNLVPMMQLARLQRYGHTPIAIAGGGTGMVGDPSGKSSERNLLSTEQIEANLDGIQEELAHILDFEVKSNPGSSHQQWGLAGEVELDGFFAGHRQKFHHQLHVRQRFRQIPYRPGEWYLLHRIQLYAAASV